MFGIIMHIMTKFFAIYVPVVLTIPHRMLTIALINIWSQRSTRVRQKLPQFASSLKSGEESHDFFAMLLLFLAKLRGFSLQWMQLYLQKGET